MAVVWWVDVIEQITVARAIHFGAATFEPIIDDFIYSIIFKQGTNRPRMFGCKLSKPNKKHNTRLKPQSLTFS